MCIWSCNNKFCGCFNLKIGTKFIILIDFIECFIILFTYLLFIVGRENFNSIGFYFIKSVPNYSSNDLNEIMVIEGLILYIVFFILLCYKTYHGYRCWSLGFTRKNVEIYFMLTFTYTVSSTI
jgi:hypothetical protein